MPVADAEALGKTVMLLHPRSAKTAARRSQRLGRCKISGAAASGKLSGAGLAKLMLGEDTAVAFKGLMASNEV